jgi:DNA-binding CsgD family transcriptional regulator/tetratricopeptide (TPR) repeat protein
MWRDRGFGTVEGRRGPLTGLLERDSELAVLTGRYQQAVTGRGGVVLLSGEAGMGKTSLVDQFAVSLRRGPVVPSAFLVGRCDDLLTPTPLGAVHDLALFAPEPGRAAVLAARDAAAAVVALVDLTRVAPSPVVLVVEDVHWADDATLDTIRQLWRRVDEAAALLVVTYRDEDLGDHHPARRLLGSIVGSRVTRLRLDPLTESAVQALASGTGVDAAELARVTGGNPFFVTEVLQAPGAEVPPTVRDAVLGRLATLSAASRAVVTVLSVVPSRCERWLADALAATVADASTSGASTAGMAEAERAGVLQGDSEAVWFRHELARQAVEAAQTAAERVQHHRTVLQELVDRVPDPARLVHHASRAGDRDTLNRHAAAAAAQAVSAGSHRQASAHFALLLEDADRIDPRQVAEYRTRLAYSLYVINEFGAATRVAEEAVKSWEQVDDARGLASASITFSMAAFWTRGPTAAAAAAERAIAVFDRLDDVAGLAHGYTALARAHSNLATLGSVSEPSPAGLQLARRAVELADRAGQDDLRSIALIYRGSARLALGDRGGAVDLVEALHLTENDPRAEFYMRSCVQAAGSAYRDGRIEAALEYVELGLRRGRDAEFFAGEYRLHLTRASALATTGRWGESVLTLRKLLADHRVDAGIMHPLAQILLARLLARRDRHTEAAALLTDARPDLGADIALVGPWAIAAVETAWLAGTPDTARAHARAAFLLARARNHHVTMAELACYCRRAGLPADPPPEPPGPWRVSLSGDWARAAEAWADHGDRYEQALELASSSDPDGLHRALDLLDALDAVAAARIVRQRLRRLGIRAVPRGPAPATRANPWNLTRRQAEILELLSSGLSNPQIAQRLVLSVRTVDHHVSAILQKLDVTTRQEAGTLALTSAEGSATDGRP